LLFLALDFMRASKRRKVPTRRARISSWDKETEKEQAMGRWLVSI
jgi:hypothetical protein